MRLLFLLFVISLTLSCDKLGLSSKTSEDDTAVSVDSLDANKSHLNKMAVLLTNVDQLRLRRYPDTKSEALTTLDENSPLYFTGEVTDYEENIGGHKGRWKKVKTVDAEYEGWVYGANHFVSDWLDFDALDSLHNSGQDIRIISNLSRSEMGKLSGANFESSLRGTRFSGYYEYKKGNNPQIIDGAMVLRARQFNTDNKKVEYGKCTVNFKDGMPSTELTCIPILKL